MKRQPPAHRHHHPPPHTHPPARRPGYHHSTTRNASEPWTTLAPRTDSETIPPSLHVIYRVWRLRLITVVMGPIPRTDAAHLGPRKASSPQVTPTTRSTRRSCTRFTVSSLRFSWRPPQSLRNTLPIGIPTNYTGCGAKRLCRPTTTVMAAPSINVTRVCMGTVRAHSSRVCMGMVQSTSNHSPSSTPTTCLTPTSPPVFSSSRRSQGSAANLLTA